MALSQIETASLSSALVAPTATALTTASGSAPSYSARAWVNFNGTGTVAIRASGNVSSITDNGVGDYTLNFATAIADANYSLSGIYSWVNGVSAGGALTIRNESGYVPTTTTCRLICQGQNATNYDRDYVYAAIFR